MTGRDGARAGVIPARAALALVVAVLAGLGTWAAVAIGRGAPSAGCTEHALRFGVTDDKAEAAKQAEFERRLPLARLPLPGLHRERLDPVATLHTASHGYVVVYTRDEPPGALVELVRRSAAQKVPLLVAAGTGDVAIRAVRDGRELTCGAAGAAEVGRVRAFVAARYDGV